MTHPIRATHGVAPTRTAPGSRGSCGVLAVVVCALAACQDPTVQNYQSPSIDPTTRAAVQQEVSGLFAFSRGTTTGGTDMLYYVQAMSSFGRDAGNFVNTDSRFITEWLGDGLVIPNGDFYGGVVWNDEFNVVKNANLILTNLPGVTPAYSASDANLIKGVTQTMKAYNFMLMAETRDTNGVPVYGPDMPPGKAPILCNRDVWAYIAALLDSGETDLDAGAPAGAKQGPLPVIVPPGFASASLAGPANVPGSFSGFNRALRAKAGLEYGYAIARQVGGASAPSAAGPGVPNVPALTSADSAAKASFIFDGGAVEYVQTTPTDYTDPLGVYHSFSGASGDQPNPMFASTSTMFVLNAADSEIVADPADRRAGKIIINIAPPGQTNYNSVVSLEQTIGTYPAATSPMSIVRNEDMVLLDAAIQLGLGNSANAISLMNAVRSAAGTTPVTPAGFVAIRTQLLHELRMSNLLETGELRTIMIRNYGVELQYTTTWGKKDTHAMIEPIPVVDNSARNGNITPQCQ